MIPLRLDAGVGTIVWSPLAQGRPARAWDEAKSGARAETDATCAGSALLQVEETSGMSLPPR